jgi:hypothetical protein
MLCIGLRDSGNSEDPSWGEYVRCEEIMMDDIFTVAKLAVGKIEESICCHEEFF